jgi:uncharacterized membrane protein (UPF0136 family)
MAFDMMTALNFVFGLVIFATGIYCYMRMKSILSLYVGSAFGIFALTHLMSLLGMGTDLATPMAVMRSIGYMAIILGLYIKIKPAQSGKSAPAKKRK